MDLNIIKNEFVKNVITAIKTNEKVKDLVILCCNRHTHNKITNPEDINSKIEHLEFVIPLRNNVELKLYFNYNDTNNLYCRFTSEYYVKDNQSYGRDDFVEIDNNFVLLHNGRSIEIGKYNEKNADEKIELILEKFVF